MGFEIKHYVTKLMFFSCVIKMLLPPKHVGFFVPHNQQFSKLSDTYSVSFMPFSPDKIYRELAGMASHSPRAQSHKTAPPQIPTIRPGSQYFSPPATNQRNKKNGFTHGASLAELYTG